METHKEAGEAPNKKTPWIGAVISLLIGPFGHFYWSWTAAVSRIVIVLVIIFWWTIIFPSTPFPAWAGFLIGPAMAIDAYFGIQEDNAIKEGDWKREQERKTAHEA